MNNNVFHCSLGRVKVVLKKNVTVSDMNVIFLVSFYCENYALTDIITICI